MKGTPLCFATLCALAAPALAQQPDVARGRYVAIIGGCNDCHTAGYPQKNGQVAEGEWLLGNPVGYRGPWGTSYPTNLRVTLSKMTEAQWVAYAQKLQARPPMPWFNLNKMSEADLRAFYHFVKGLGAPGKPAPDPLPPNAEPNTPFVVFVPQPPKK
jgi:mono/diheme cytochrome c family protein